MPPSSAGIQGMSSSTCDCWEPVIGLVEIRKIILNFIYLLFKLITLEFNFFLAILEFHCSTLIANLMYISVGIVIYIHTETQLPSEQFTNSDDFEILK